jgi:hypothetical protein
LEEVFFLGSSAGGNRPFARSFSLFFRRLCLLSSSLRRSIFLCLAMNLLHNTQILFKNDPFFIEKLSKSQVIPLNSLSKEVN